MKTLGEKLGLTLTVDGKILIGSCQNPRQPEITFDGKKIPLNLTTLACMLNWNVCIDRIAKIEITLRKKGA